MCGTISPKTAKKITKIRKINALSRLLVIMFSYGIKIDDDDGDDDDDNNNNNTITIIVIIII